jgi:CheY-like chemotaxis protein
MLHFVPRSLPLRVLCVEEDAVQRKLLEACLDVVGAEGLFADSAAQGLRLFHRNAVDMVLMDLDMHAADEISAFEEMRAAPRGGPPILAVTDNECRWTDEDYRDAGFAGLFLKPVEPERLFTEMDRALRDCGRPPLLAHVSGAVGFNYMH